jgi:PelA/Pel-15E family pectate lyase
VEIILASQVRIAGHLTIWAQQIDPLTLAPSSARNYEMPSLASSETSDVLVFLMRQPHPSAALKQAVRAGVAWLQAHAIEGQTWTMTPNGRELQPAAGAGPIWARYYSLTTEQPIFGDRDKSIHDNVAEISLERRNGYSWYNNAAARALRAYEHWRAANP